MRLCEGWELLEDFSEFIGCRTTVEAGFVAARLSGTLSYVLASNNM